ncbi:MAG: hypothetical protein M5U33_04460 [Pseudorhodoplanes sp.]|nr:hypothetical protein [Pseudorhodoplanes sp.]
MPEVLLSGNHAKIAAFRREQAERSPGNAGRTSGRFIWRAGPGPRNHRPRRDKRCALH